MQGKCNFSCRGWHGSGHKCALIFHQVRADKILTGIHSCTVLYCDEGVCTIIFQDASTTLNVNLWSWPRAQCKKQNYWPPIVALSLCFNHFVLSTFRQCRFANPKRSAKPILLISTGFLKYPLELKKKSVRAEKKSVSLYWNFISVLTEIFLQFLT